MAEESEGRSGSDTEWITIYSRRRHSQTKQLICSKNMQEDAGTTSIGTQTDIYDIPEETLRTLAQKTAQGLDVNSDLDRTLFSSLRLLIGYEPINAKLVDLMGYESGTYPTAIIRRKGPEKPGRVVSEPRQKNKGEQTQSILSILIGDIIDQGRPCDDNINAYSSSTESTVTQSEMDTPQKNDAKNASVEVSLMISFLGYGPRIRKARINAYREGDRVWNARSTKCPDVNVITAGSKAEGLTSFYESDRDGIYVLPRVLCVEDGIDIRTIPDEMNVFRMNTRVYPGHCKLLLERLGPNGHPVLLSALIDDGSKRFLLSSDLFAQDCSSAELGPDEVRHEREGPSNPATFVGALNTDTVFALPCHCPSILQRWAGRTRHWPPPDIVQKVVSMGAFVTPVGFKGSEKKNEEWRICFNTGEAELMNCLNDTLVNLYVILKMVLKNVLNPSKKEVTSYTLKNIVLWIAENNKQTLFYDKSLLHVLREGLGKLRTVISSKQLPYYMIPERNLMAACGLENEQQRIWVATITEIMDEGPRIILRLKTMRQAVISYPQPLLWYSKLKAELEILTLEYRNRYNQCKDQNGLVDDSDGFLQETRRRLNEIVTEVRERLLFEGSWIDDINEIHYRMLR